MYHFYLYVSKINEKAYAIFILPETLMSGFDVALNKRNAGLVSVFYAWSFTCNDSTSLAINKRISETKCYLSSKIERSPYLSTLTSAQRITISICH